MELEHLVGGDGGGTLRPALIEAVALAPGGGVGICLKDQLEQVLVLARRAGHPHQPPVAALVAPLMRQSAMLSPHWMQR